jgi:hypothetical protein
MPIMSEKPEPRETSTGTVAEQVAHQLNEILFDIRKSFGMFGRTNWAVTEVGSDVVTVRFFNWPADVPVTRTAANVRNAMLNLLRDTIPCSHFHAAFGGSDPGSVDRRVELDFYPPEAAELPSQLVVIEENAEPRRSHWRALVDRSAGSDTYFTRARGERST